MANQRHEFARWCRYGPALSIAIWDIDKFKSVNVSYGLQAGDKALYKAIHSGRNRCCTD